MRLKLVNCNYFQGLRSEKGSFPLDKFIYLIIHEQFMNWKKIIIKVVILIIASYIIIHLPIINWPIIILIADLLRSFGFQDTSFIQGHYWPIFSLFFIPFANLALSKIIFKQDFVLKETVIITLICMSIIIPISISLELYEDYQYDKDIKEYSRNEEQYNIIYNNAYKSLDPSLCGGGELGEICFVEVINDLIFYSNISEEKKWKLCMQIATDYKRQGCYSDILLSIDVDNRVYPKDIGCDSVKDEKIKQECVDINNRIKVEEIAYNPNRMDTNLASCGSLNPFHKAVCYSIVANTRPLCSNICNLLSSEIIINKNYFENQMEKTQREVCEFYCEARERRKTMN